MFLTNRRNVAIAAGVLVLAGIGAAAWIHSAESPPAPAPATGAASAPTAALAPTPVVASYDNSQSGAVNSGGVNYGTVPAVSGSESGYYPSIPPPAYVSQPQPAPPPPEPAANAYAGGQYTAGVQYSGASRKSYREYRVHHHRRSKKHSIEIVAGTAAAGAAIGAIAGGGPGAAIGAISGAGAGFVYDRLTHNHN
jgi:hypothetical protein